MDVVGRRRASGTLVASEGPHALAYLRLAWFPPRAHVLPCARGARRASDGLRRRVRCEVGVGADETSRRHDGEPARAYRRTLGGGIEWLVVPHHAVTASFSYVSVTPGCCSAATGQSGGGGGGSPENLIRGTSVELGYRYYDHPELPKGPWFAPSLVLFHGAGSVDGTPTGELTQVGIAVDGGVQALLWDRVALGAGVGFEAVYSFTKTRPTLEDAPLAMLAFGDRYLLSRVGPRLLVNVGAAL